jgi:hypothetical protein
MHIIYGLLITTGGVAMIFYSESLLRNIGRIGFFEAHLSSAGGSRLGYKLIGIVLTFIGIILLTGLYDNFMQWLLSPLIRPAIQQ